MSYRKPIILNTSTSILLQFVIALFGFITPALIIKQYGSELNGIVSSINQLLRYFTLIEAGLGGAAVFYLVRYLSAKDYKNVNIILSYSKKSYIKIGIIFSTIVLLFTPIYAMLANNQNIDKVTIASLFLLFGLTTSIEYFIMSKCRVLLHADQKSYYISIFTIISTIVSQVLTIFLIINNVNILLIYTLSLIINLIRGISLNYFVRKHYKDLISFSSIIDKKFSLNMQKDVFFHEIFYTIISALPLLVITFIYDFEKVSIYTVYNMPIIMINIILSTIYQSITATFTHNVNEGNIKKENIFFKNFYFVYFFFATVMLISTAILLTPFIKIYTFGISDLNYVNPVLGYMLIMFSLANTFRVIYAIPTASHGLFKETSKIAIMFVFIAIIVSVISGYFLGFEYALLGPIISFLSNAIYQKNVQNKRVTSFKNSLPILIFLISFILVTLLYLYFQINPVIITSWLNFFMLSALIGTIVSLAFLVFFYFLYVISKERIFDND
ncbi:MAG: hypothetical protein AB1414_00600 [bacterium]